MINVRHAKEFCSGDITEIENYAAAVNDVNETWICHHILGEILTSEQLKDHDFYYNVPPCMLKFVTKAEHNNLHNQGKHLSDETRRKMSESLKGRHAWNKGKQHNAETRKKISESNKGKVSHRKGVTLSEETRKKLSEAHKGRRTKGSAGMHWYNNGVENILTYTCPDGYIKGRLK